MRDTFQNFWFLRLFAASTVIFSHSFLIAEGTEENEPFVRLFGRGNIVGIYGVYAFFIISGFLITRSALSSRTTASFAIKRIARIYPALLACAFLSAALIGTAFTTLDVSQFWNQLIPIKYTLRTALRADYGLQVPTVAFPYETAVLTSKSAHGWAEVNLAMNGSYWTIPQELNCYLFILILLALGWLNGRIMLSVMIFSFVSIKLLHVPVPSFAIVENFAFVFPSFAAGACLYFAYERGLLTAFLALASVGILAVAAYVGHLDTFFHVFGAAPLLWVATTPKVRLPVLHQLGDPSYGMYLWGWPVEQTVRTLLGQHSSWFGVFVISWFVALALGVVSWHLLEKHALKLAETFDGWRKLVFRLG